MSTLYIRVPSHGAAGEPQWPALPCPFALVPDGKASHEGTIERQGVMPLPDLSGTIARANRIVLLLAAADVTLLRIKVPPLSQARLKAALPNLVEDQLIGDPSGCVIAAGSTHGGLRTVTVVQRAWLEHLAKTLITLGARRIAALPAQLCLPAQPDTIVAAINGQNDSVDATLRLSEQDGIGLTIAPGEEEHEPQQTPAHEIIRTLRAIVPEAPIALYVPQAQEQAYQQAAAYQQTIDGIAVAHPTAARISVLADNWPHWIAGAKNAGPDLMAGLGAAAAPRLEWRAWRWPLALAAAILLINIGALNFDWWRKKSESNSLRAAMTQIYKAAYPKDPVVIDPLAQIRQKIAAAKRDAGLPSPGDFIALAAAFGEACALVMPGRTATAIAAIEYHERSLIVQLKPGIEAPTQQLKTALAERNLTLELAPAQGAAVTWQIRTMK